MFGGIAEAEECSEMRNEKQLENIKHDSDTQ